MTFVPSHFFSHLSTLVKLSTFIAGCNIISLVQTSFCTISACIFIYTLINYNDPCKTWVKISKVMPHSHSPFPLGKGGKPYGKKSKSFGNNMIRLNRTHSYLNLQAKFFNYVLYFSKNSSELSKIRSIRPHSPRITRNSHHLLTHYIVYFRCLTSGRELSGIPANHTNSAQFTHIIRKLHEIRTIY